MGIAVQKMFDGIAKRYDFLNHFLSIGRDKVWRDKAVKYLDKQIEGPAFILDLCGGTGDFWLSWYANQKKNETNLNGTDKIKPIRGIIADFSFPMLLEGKRKVSELNFSQQIPAPYIIRMDALRPCFKDHCMDAVICAYGMRNLDSILEGLKKINSLSKTNGIFITLEFFRPTHFFTWFFYHILAPLCIPFLGWIFSSRKQAYQYLVTSIQKFLSSREYSLKVKETGFNKVAIVPCDFGISHIIIGTKGGN